MENYKIDIEMSFTPPNPVRERTACKVSHVMNTHVDFQTFLVARDNIAFNQFLVVCITPAGSNNVDDLFIIIDFFYWFPNRSQPTVKLNMSSVSTVLVILLWRRFNNARSASGM